ncbi:MAG: polysaccharide deacetylase family protein [Acutalibacteraceae bacterium]|nr:polysaccharide deacetylase family protein [Acutalibacteraceae bacterium]
MMWYMRFPEGKTKALTLSYDDGVLQDKRLVEIMNKNGIKGTFNINSAFFGDTWITPTGAARGRMTVDEAQACYESGGHEVAVHSHTHPFLERIPLDSLAYEIIKDREILEKEFGCIVKGMAYPMGTFSDEVVNVLKACGICYSRTTKSTERFDIPTDWLRMPATCHHKNPRLMELAKDFAETDVTRFSRLFYLWGHSYEFDDDDNWDVIEKFCEYIGAREDIWYATNMEIYEYIEAYNRLKTSADGHIMYNPTNKTLWMHNQNWELYSIGPGETLKI